MPYPVLRVVDALKQELAEHPVVILQAPPGAGKSTVLPLQLIDELWLSGRKIIMLEPRRLAARSVAMRMASMLQEDVGKTVGYRVRFESRTSAQTKIEVVTEGILTRMIQQDNALENAGLVILDEFHERSLQADLALALSLQVQKILRNDLRLLIMSATLDSQKLSALLDNAPVVTSHGIQHPVTMHYIATDQSARISLSVTTAIRRACREHFGDILVFLPGAGEITQVLRQLEEEEHDAVIYPLYGDLPFKKQQEAILPDPSGRRKIILATSIAETSLTIEGIAVVIDSGYSRVPRFDPRSGLTRLDTIRVTKDAADQRAGRAGRLGPGVCYRLWSEGVQANLVPHRKPEILEADLAPLMLELAAWGTRRIEELTWITLPPAGAVSQATELLSELKAINDGKITARGQAMLRLPTHPRIAHMLIEASSSMQDGDMAIASDLAALLEERDPLAKEAGADISLRLEVLRKWRSGERVDADRQVLERIERLAASWRRLLKIPEDNKSVHETVVGKLMIEAYPERIAKQTEKNSERYKLANGRVARLPQHDQLTRHTWLSIAHLDAGMGEGKIFLAAPLDSDDLEALAVERTQVRWDAEREMLVGTVETHINNLVLSSRPLSNIPDEERIDVLCKVIQENGLKMLGWQDVHTAWQARVMSLRAWRPEEGWPDVSTDGLLATVKGWLSPFLQQVSKRADLLRLDLIAMLNSILPWNLSSKLDVLAPSRIQVPSGSMISVLYHADGRPPVMEVRLQEVFGLNETPTVNEGRTRIILHLLSPGFKPVQVTQDLKSFWNNTYAEVRKELRTRYPKHSWPEDPWTAEPIRGAKKRQV